MKLPLSAPTGRPVKAQGKAKRCPGYGAPMLFPALKGRNMADPFHVAPPGSAPSGRGILLTPDPGALPRAVTLRPVGAERAANLHESRTLATRRDMLLPKLLRGEITPDLTP